jgi:hypothetical protein
MTRLAHILALSAALVALVGSTDAAARTNDGPTGLHPFLLRVDEPTSRTFSRTPAFAWNPVKGAQRYEFQLSTSGAFRDSGVIYSDTSLTSPVASPALTLPWITGSPHALYARVRAVLDDSTTPWSDGFGFDMEPAAVPQPVASYPGLLRWTPTDGASGYQVWFVDLPKMVYTQTNVLDEREFYSFHQAASWLGQVRWRIRALRDDFNSRANGLPVVGYGPWSPVYSSVNPPFAVGALTPTATVSDIVSTGAPSAPAHRLTPAFVFGGNAPQGGAAAELFRVQVFTDKRCINRVYTSAIVGSPAYAPRYSGPLSLPRTGAAIASARSSYLPDGDEGPSFAFDMDSLTANESLPSVKPTIGLPAAAAATTTPATGSAPSGGAAAPTPAPAAPAAPGGAAAAPAVVELLKVAPASKFGPPVGLWDTDWSSGGGYYWTVIPVEARVPGASSTNIVGAGAAIGATSIPVANSSGFAVGDLISVGNAGNLDTATITVVAAGTISVAAQLKLAHGSGEPVVRTSGNIQYRDLELAQDACASGRVLRFGKASEPALTTGGEAFASGLSPDGKLESAGEAPSFYGAPLVAWTPALGAETYAVQWSKTRHPFKPEADPATLALGMMTLNTSAVLPLEPGTWYYRVRGYDYSLPETAQAMSWSDPQKIVATRPTFAVVAGETAADKTTSKTRTLTAASAGFSIKLPRSFREGARTTSAASGGQFRPLGSTSSKLRLSAHEAAGAALFVQTSPSRGQLSQAAWTQSATAAAKRAGATACSGVSLSAGAGVRCTGIVRSGGAKQTAVVYLLQHRNATYTLTFAGRLDRRAADTARFGAAARSFRFTR